MKPPKFEYHRPTSVEAAIELLAQYDGDARLLAGGQSLIPMLNFRLLAPAALIDLNALPELGFIREEADRVAIGAVTRQRALEFSPLVERHLPLVRLALKLVGHLPTRTRGTIGGSLMQADPAAELPMISQVLDAEMRVRGPRTDRVIKAADLFESLMTTSLAADEILVEIRFPKMHPQAGYALEEFARRHGDFAMAAIAVVIEPAPSGSRKVRIAAGGINPVPLRLARAEEVLQSGPINDAAITEAARLAAADVDPMDDANASSDFRRHLAGVLSARAIRTAADMAQKGLNS